MDERDACGFVGLDGVCARHHVSDAVAAYDTELDLVVACAAVVVFACDDPYAKGAA